MLAVATVATTSFNSRTREGCDPPAVLVSMLSFIVSIHAPGRGATSSDFCTKELSGFQFTHPGGVRHLRSTLAALWVMFQFTHPGGVRRIAIGSVIEVLLFQFTHPGGVRHLAPDI